MSNLLLRVPEVAENLGISRAKVYELMASGQLPSLRIGHSRRIPAEAIRRFIEQHEEAVL